ncbi:MAG: DUF1080 domain-containing protein [Candidatus Kerfeldbacteria bacterium]|nr:DUF1080 domain-containing protein [Candidatus Kerfeldbacteria bacterium]
MERRKRQSRTKSGAGFTLIEGIISLFVVSMMISLLVAIGNVRAANRRAVWRSKAAALADEAVNSLRRLDYATIANQTNGPLLNVLYNAGPWRIASDATGGSSHSTPNVLEAPLQSGFTTNQVSSRMLLPAGVYSDFTLQAEWKIQPDSPNTWSVGFLVRSRDVNNGYRLRLAQNDGSAQTDLDSGTAGIQNVLLEKIVSGTATTLKSVNATLSKNAWFTLALAATGSTFTISLNGISLGTATDTTFATGPAALVGWAGVHAYADDVKTVAAASCSSSTCWDFEGAANLTASWIRLGLNDLPDNTPTTLDDNGKLTITSYPDPASIYLKKATVTITWMVNGVTQSFSADTFIGKSEFGL